MDEKDAKPATDKKEPKTKKKFPLWQKVVAGAVVVIVVLVLAVNMLTSGVVKVSNEFVNDMQAQNADGAYALMTKDAQAATDKSQFKDVVDRAGPILNTKEKMTGKEVKGETGNAASGKVTYEIKGTDGVTYKITVNLQKEDGQWRVLNFESTR